jgi:L-threonylcarbamoyladenylate synthase
LGRLADRFWPGALTVVGARRAAAPPWVGDDATLAVRCPDDALLRSLAVEVGPLAATSANRHGEPTPTGAAGVATALPSVDLVIDGGVRRGVASSVVAVDETGLVVLREGAIPAADISAVLESPS